MPSATATPGSIGGNRASARVKSEESPEARRALSTIDVKLYGFANSIRRPDAHVALAENRARPEQRRPACHQG